MVTASDAKPFLLDTNVLLALSWPQHVHHRRAHDWFRRIGAHAWASCAITQLGFVRISANPRITVAGVTPRAAVALLAEFAQMPGHRYLSDLPPVTTAALFSGRQLLGHGQVTDLYLLSLAMHHSCRLATMDEGIAQLLPVDEERKRWVELVN